MAKKKKKNKRAPQSEAPGEGRKFYSCDKLLKESQADKQKEFFDRLIKLAGIQTQYYDGSEKNINGFTPIDIWFKE